MAQPDRETVYAALLTLLQTALGATFATYTRRFRAVTNTPVADAPVLTQVQAFENSDTKKGIPTVHKFTVHLLIYANFGSEAEVVPMTALNGLITALEASVGPNLATGYQQLGIPVSSVVVNGQIEYGSQESTTGTWAAALVPVEIVATY